MPTKKTVIPEEALPEEEIQVEAPAPVAPKQAKKITVFIVAAPFELDGEQYAVGDEVSPAGGWKRDTEYDARRLDQQIGLEVPPGITFVKDGPPIDKSGERNSFRVTLPVREA